MSEHERFEVNKSDLKSRIRSELGLDVENITPLDAEELGDNSEVYRATQGGEKVIIKLLANDYDLQLEQAIFSLYNSYDIPSPNVRGLLLSSENQKALIIETEIEGTPISNLENNVAIYEKVGQVLKNIHNIKIEGFGGLDITDDGLIGSAKNWKENVEEYKIDFAALQKQGVIDESTRIRLDQAYKIILNADLPRASIIHNDFQPQHVFSDGENITGIIDVSSSYAGDPRMDIAYMQYHLEGDELEAFNRGYGELATDPLMPAYRVMVAISKIDYRVERGYTYRLPAGLKMLSKMLEGFKS